MKGADANNDNKNERARITASCDPRAEKIDSSYVTGLAVGHNPAALKADSSSTVAEPDCDHRSCSAGSRNRGAAASWQRQTRPGGIVWYSSVAPSLRLMTARP